MKTSVAILAAGAMVAAAGVGAATPYLISGANIRPGTVPERALVPSLQKRINAPFVRTALPVADIDHGQVLGFTSTYVERSLPTQSDNAITSIFAFCPSGTTIVSGGFGADSLDTQSAVQVLSSAPDQANNSWAIDVRNLTGVTVTVRAFAYCARLS